MQGTNLHRKDTRDQSHLLYTPFLEMVHPLEETGIPTITPMEEIPRSFLTSESKVVVTEEDYLRTMEEEYHQMAAAEEEVEEAEDRLDQEV